MADKLGLPKEERSFIEFAAKTWRESNFTMRKIQPAWNRGVRAHAETQRIVIDRYPRSGAEEYTGVSGPGPKRSDLAYRPHTGPVVELKPWAYVLDNGRIMTSRMAVASGVATLQMQAYEITGREQGRPTVVITAAGNLFAPDPSASTGWIQIGGPGW